MKFKNDGCGWRDLLIGHDDGDSLSVSLDTAVSGDEADKSPFISIKDGDTFAAFSISRKKLRKFAHAILMELGRE